MKIVFMGTPDFAKESLKALYDAGHNILAVVTNPDKPKGRGMKMIQSPVKEFADEHQIKVYQPLKVRNNEEFINDILKLNPDAICVVAYGKILPKELLNIPTYGAINVHGSLLPKYRGAAPIQWAVLNGEKETGITTMFMDEGMDTGDMILQEKVKIGQDETTGELWNELSKIGANLLVKTLAKIEEAKKQIEKTNCKILKQNVELTKETIIANQEEKELILKEVKKLVGAIKQNDDFTLAPMLKKEMAEINWDKSANEIKNLVRGLNPIIGAYTTLEDRKIKIWKVDVIKNEEFKTKFIVNNENLIMKKENDCKNGEILLVDNKKGLFVKTKDEIISILEIQCENSKKMDIKSFLNGNNIKAGTILN